MSMPFVVLGSRPGLEILHPLAVVLLGGIASAVLVALFLLPPLYLHFGPRQSSGQEPAGESAQPEPAEASAPSDWQSRPLDVNSATRESEA